jgi:hypothetical protein
MGAVRIPYMIYMMMTRPTVLCKRHIIDNGE